MSTFSLFGSFTSQEQIDGAYQVAATQDDLFRARQRAEGLSSDTRARLETIEGVPYGPTLAEHLDIFPSGNERSPVFVFFHGGFWRAMSSSDYSFVAEGLNRDGFLTVSVNYELAPCATIDEIVRQARAAVAWVVRNIDRYGGDPDRIVIGGHSAGAHLAAMCLLTRWRETYGLAPDVVRGAVLISGIYELAPLRYSHLQPKIQLDDGIIHRCSPSNHVRSLKLRTLFAVGEKETSEFHRQTSDFQKRWTSVGNDSILDPIEGADHFGAVEPLLHRESSMCRWIRNAVDLD